VGGVVHVAPGRSALYTGGARRGVHIDALHRRKVYHEAVVTKGEAGAVVPAAADGERQAVVAGEVDGGDDVRRVHAAGDEGRLFVDHCVVDAASLIVTFIAWLDEPSAQPGLQAVDGGSFGCWDRAIRHDPHSFLCLR